MRDKSIRGFLSVLSSEVGFLFIGVVITPFLVRILGSDGYGDYSFVLSIILVLMIFANAGIFDGARKYLSEDRSVDRWQDVVFGYYLRSATVFGLVIALLLVAVTYTGLASRIVEPRFELYLYLAAAVIFARQFYYTTRAVLMGIGLEQYGEPLRVVKQLSFGVLGISLAYIGYGIAGVLMGHIIAHVLIAVVGLYLISRHLDMMAIIRPPDTKLPRKEMLLYNGWTVVLMALLFSLYHVDILMLQPISGSDQTGYYKAALVIAEFLWLVPSALQLVLLQSSSELWSQGRYEEASGLSSQAVRITLLLTALLALGITALAEPFVKLYYGPGFGAAIGPLLLLLPGAIGFALARPIYSIAQGMGKLRTLVIATGAAAIINLILNFILIPRHGMYGAAVATSTGYASMFIFHTYAARHIGYDPLNDLRVPEIAITVVVSGVMVIGAARIIQSSILSLVIIPPLGAIVYSVVALRTGAVTQTEITEFLEALPEPLNSVGGRLL